MDLGTRRLWEQGQDTIIEERRIRSCTLIDFNTITETLTPPPWKRKDLLATKASVEVARIVIEMMRGAEIAYISKNEPVSHPPLQHDTA